MDGRKSEKFGPLIYTQKIYILSIALYIYAYIYIGKVEISFGEATKVVCVGERWERGNLPGGGSEPLGPQLRSPPQTMKPPPHSMWPWAAFHIMGRGSGGKGGLVSKLSCNLRKSPGSVGSGKAPHLAEKGGALGRGAGSGRVTSADDITSHPPPCPGQAGVWEPKGPHLCRKSPFRGLEADTPGLEGTEGRQARVLIRPLGTNISFCLLFPAPCP